MRTLDEKLTVRERGLQLESTWPERQRTFDNAAIDSPARFGNRG